MISNTLAGVLLVATAVCVAAAQSPAAASNTFDETRPPGENYDKAEFRLWIPEGSGALRATVVLVPGSNGDGRPMVADTVWQSFANRNHVALFGIRFTDKPHDQSFIEDYVNVSRGSGQTTLDALTSLATKANHAELGSAPLFL